MKHKNEKHMNELINQPKTPGLLVNECLFWIEGLMDGTCQTSTDVLAVFDMAIGSLQRARQEYSLNLED